MSEEFESPEYPAESNSSAWEDNTFESAPQPEPRREPEYHAPAYRAPEPAPKKGHGVWKVLLCAVLIIAMIAGSCVTTALVVGQRSFRQNQILQARLDSLEAELESQKTIAAPAQTVSPGDLLTPAQVYEMNHEKVVAISCTVQSSAFGRVTTGKSSGSGFIFTADGYIVTNYHVVENASEIKVIFHDNTSYPAVLAGKDAVNDVAVLKIDAQGLDPVALGSSNQLGIGDMVAAIGNPLGSNLNATLTVGYVSGKDRQIGTNNETINMLQTDASINAGNSGGPLFNMYGQVVGITSAKYSGTTSSGASIEGIGFAIPIDDVTGILGDLKVQGYVSTSYLGITCQDVDSQSIQLYNLPAGAYVVTVTEGNCAQKAGVEPKDIITRLGDFEVGSRNDLLKALRQYHPGEETTITVFRSGEEITLDIVLDEKPQEEAPVPAEEMPSEGNFQEWFDFFSEYFGK